MIIRVGLLVLTGSLFVAGYQTLLFADANRDEARALAETSQYREDLVLQGIRWYWLWERGQCQNIDDGMLGKFNDQVPVDKYECHWFSNKGTMLYESIAQQPFRKLKTEGNVLLTTNGSESFLWTKSSRLLYAPYSIANWSGVAENREHGFATTDPESTPVHAGGFGLGRISYLLSTVTDPQVDVTVEQGQTLHGRTARVLRYHNKDGSESVRYFDPETYCPLQIDSFTKTGSLRSRNLVSETRRLTDATGTLELPTSYLSCFKSDDRWMLDRVTTTEVERVPVPLAEMVIPAKDAILVMNPHGGKVSANFVTEFTAENLDSVIERMFTLLERDLARYPSGKRLDPAQGKAGGRRIAYIIAFNAVLIAALVGWYLWPKRAAVVPPQI